MATNDNSGTKAQGGHGLQTIAVHAASAAGRVQGACVPPIFQAATFQYEGTEASYDDVRYAVGMPPQQTNQWPCASDPVVLVLELAQYLPVGCCSSRPEKACVSSSRLTFAHSFTERYAESHVKTHAQGLHPRTPNQLHPPGILLHSHARRRRRRQHRTPPTRPGTPAATTTPAK